MNAPQHEKFNEATRVQLPALVHLTRLGYQYFGKIAEDQAGTAYDPDTNILLDVFKTQFARLNPGQENQAAEVLRQIRQELDFDDLGRSFYTRLCAVSPVRLIDFERPENNVYHCTAEFTCKCDGDEFRPDITLFVNGLPLAFVEVKKPNNHGGMTAESERMNSVRFPNKKFRRFINITQLMIFSNNMEYDTEGGVVPVQGAFYCTAARKRAPFNCFREENPAGGAVAPFHLDYTYLPINHDIEKRILADFNCHVLLRAPEYQSNLSTNTPTNRILTSMCSPARLLFLLKYGIAYVKSEREVDGKIESTDEKHIMRYQQLFAALAVRRKLSDGVKSGVIWHTQGSGKTALSYYLHGVLTDHYAAQDKVAKFYFIVDRLDLLEQAAQEFEARGLVVKTASSRDELMAQFRAPQSREGASGKREIVVVNIQKFKDDPHKVTLPPYATKLQRIFIVDEAHRGYNPKGSFLANLFDADRDAVKIALTGTPLLKEERESWRVFGNYLHTYYYDQSIQDGYTLRMIREDIETGYRERLTEICDTLDALVRKKSIKPEHIYTDTKYVDEFLSYILLDFQRFRAIQDDDSLGAMVVCPGDNDKPARAFYEAFDRVQSQLAEQGKLKKRLHAALILHNEGDKQTRKGQIAAFKKNLTVDILFVYNMLLTGFDAPRLKRLYLGRRLKDHSLLLALTRVNRPFGRHRYGYVIDFADIKANFDATNEAYLRELNRFNDPEETGQGNETQTFRAILEDKETLIEQMKQVREALFAYDTANAEEFSKQISAIDDKAQLLQLKKSLETARDTCNVVRTFGDDELKTAFARLQVEKLPLLLKEVEHRIALINAKDAFKIDENAKMLICDFMENIEFTFTRKGKEELKVASGGVELRDKWRRAIRAFTSTRDPDDPVYISLREQFMAYFQKHGFELHDMTEYEAHTRYIEDVLKKLTELYARDDALLRKYSGDPKFLRLHKRVAEENKRRAAAGQPPVISKWSDDVQSVLLAFKTDIDGKIYDRADIIKHDGYFDKAVLQTVALTLAQSGISATNGDRDFLKRSLIKQYLGQLNGDWYN